MGGVDLALGVDTSLVHARGCWARGLPEGIRRPHESLPVDVDIICEDTMILWRSSIHSPKDMVIVSPVRSGGVHLENLNGSCDRTAMVTAGGWLQGRTVTRSDGGFSFFFFFNVQAIQMEVRMSASLGHSQEHPNKQIQRPATWLEILLVQGYREI